MSAACAILLTWVLDAAWGEPRNAWHPVAWLGRLVGWMGRPLPQWRAAAAFAGGALCWLVVTASVAGLGWFIDAALRQLPFWAGLPLLAWLLKPALAWRMLREEVTGVEAAFAHGLPAAREQVGRICSRDVRQFDAAEVRETGLESLSENFNDSLVAPLFWFAVAGLAGAWAFRAVNTMDAMWGYRGKWEWGGKCAARADDVLAWIPARLSALLLWRPGVSCARLRREAARTPSPNGGWPMAALALRLGVRLSKPGAYVLNRRGRPADAAAMARALRIMDRAAAAAFITATGAVLLREWLWAL